MSSRFGSTARLSSACHVMLLSRTTHSPHLIRLIERFSTQSSPSLSLHHGPISCRCNGNYMRSKCDQASYNLIWSPPLFGRQTWKEDERCDVLVSALFEIAGKNAHALVVKPVEILHPQIASLNASCRAFLMEATNSLMTSVMSRYNDKLGPSSIMRMEEVNDTEGAAGWESVCTTDEGGRKGARVKVKRFEFIQA